MKSFFYKLVLVSISIILIYKFTIGDEIASIIKKTNSISTKEGRKETIRKIKNEIKRANE